MRIAIYKEGKPERSFTIEVLKRIQDGLDMDNINHSHTVPSKSRPFVASEIHKRMRKFLNNRLLPLTTR